MLENVACMRVVAWWLLVFWTAEILHQHRPILFVNSIETEALVMLSLW